MQQDEGESYSCGPGFGFQLDFLLTVVTSTGYLASLSLTPKQGLPECVSE